MSHSVSPPPIRKPAIPPLMRESFTRLPKRLSHQPSFAKNTPPFKTSRMPQLPPLYDFILAAVITSEPEPEDIYGLDTQTWDEEKHTLASLAMRGRKYFESKVLEKVQDLAPGPFKDLKAIQTITSSITAIETLALLGITYEFPRPSNDPLPINRVHNPRQAVEHVANMFLAYIGALRVRYRHNERLNQDSISRLDRYLDDLISPNVWIKLDDLVKARSRGQKFGEQQLLNPARKTLAERMTSNIQPSPTSLAGVKTQVPAFELNSPSMLHSPASRSNPLLSSSTPTRHSHNSLPPRPISPNTSSSDLSDNGIGPMRGVPRGPRADPMGKKPRRSRGKRR